MINHHFDSVSTLKMETVETVETDTLIHSVSTVGISKLIYPHRWKQNHVARRVETKIETRGI